MCLPALAETMARPGAIFDFWNNFSAANVGLSASVTYSGLVELGRVAREIEAVR